MDIRLLGAGAERPGLLPTGDQAHLHLELEQLLVGGAFVFQLFELIHQIVGLELLLQLRCGERLALDRLDLFRHALERLEGALVVHA